MHENFSIEVNIFNVYRLSKIQAAVINGFEEAIKSWDSIVSNNQN